MQPTHTENDVGKQMDEYREQPSYGVILNELGHVKDDIKELQDTVNKLKEKVEALDRSVTILCEQFKPIRRVVYGMVTVILTSVLGAVLLLVVRRG